MAALYPASDDAAVVTGSGPASGARIDGLGTATQHLRQA
jgi:hypothetical protein